jgi:hypothetical protein
MQDYPAISDADFAPKQYRVSIWEGITIVLGALFLTVFGLGVLGVKALNNAADPGRAEAIAHSMIAYKLPGGARGVFGTNLGGVKLALVQSMAPGGPNTAAEPDAQPARAELFVAQIPVTEEIRFSNAEDDPSDDFFLSYQTEGTFQIAQTRTESKVLCGTPTPIKIQQGTLTTRDQTASMPAVRYEAQIVNRSKNQIVILSTAGATAHQDAETVFQSLRCR